MDSNTLYIGHCYFNGHYGRRDWHVVDPRSQEHSNLPGDDPCAGRVACVVTARKSASVTPQELSMVAQAIAPHSEGLRQGSRTLRALLTPVQVLDESALLLAVKPEPGEKSVRIDSSC